MKWRTIDINEILSHRTHRMDAKTSVYSAKCPYKYKHELVDWATKYKGWNKSTVNSLSKKQLYAIWYKNANY